MFYHAVHVTVQLRVVQLCVEVLAIVQLWKLGICKTEPQYHETLTLHVSPFLSPHVSHPQSYILDFLFVCFCFLLCILLV